MIKGILKVIGALIFGVLLTVSLTACGLNDYGHQDDGDDEEREEIRTYLGTQSPGDVWSWALNWTEHTFSARNYTSGYAYSGTVETLSNLFLRLEVTATSDPGIGVGEIAYALEFPDTALLVKEPEAGTDLIVCAGQGDCPTSSGTYIWVTMTWPGWNGNTSTAWGTTDSTLSGSTFDFCHEFYLLDGTANGTEADNGFTCAEGQITKLGDETTVAMTPSGVFIGDSGPMNGGFVGTAQPASPPDLTDGSDGVCAPGREYRGALFKHVTAGGGSEVKPIWARPTGSHAIEGGEYTDFEGNVEDHANVVELALDPVDPTKPNGFITGTLNDGTNHLFLIIARRIGGKYMMFGISLDNDGAGVPDPTRPYNFVVIER